MPAFMVCRGFAIFLPDDFRFAFQTHVDLVLGIVQVGHIDFFLVPFGPQKGGFVNQVFQVCTGKTGCTLSKDDTVHVRAHRRFFHVNL